MHGYERAYLAYLQQVPMFTRCSTTELELVAAEGKVRQAEAGEEIVREGDVGEEFFVIVGGKAAVTRKGSEIASLGEGDYFGELTLLDPAPRNATVTAGAPLTMIVLSRDAFAAVLDRSPAIRDRLLSGMARRLHELDAKV
jgi:CRP-like cAMP-binding protein